MTRDICQVARFLILNEHWIVSFSECAAARRAMCPRDDFRRSRMGQRARPTGRHFFVFDIFCCWIQSLVDGSHSHHRLYFRAPSVHDVELAKR